MTKFYVDYNGGTYSPQVFVFNGGEVQVRCPLPDVDCVEAHIIALLKSSDDLMALVLLTDALRQQQIHTIDVTIPYMPYARQDRVCAPGEACSIRVAANIINAQNYRQVGVWDAHSDVTPALLNNCVNVSASQWLPNALRHDRRTVLVAPDAGALKKVGEYARYLNLQYIRADKTRDPVTGSITGTSIVNPLPIGAADFLIVDDICDGGRTFIELAKQLRQWTDGAVNLYVTHGIFSQGTEVFNGIIDHIYVANSFVETLPNNFTKVA